MNKKSQTFVILASSCFLMVAGGFVSMWYIVSRLGVHFDVAKQAITEHTAKEASYNKVQSLLQSTKDDRALISSFFIKEKDIISFITDLEKNAAQVGVKLTTNQLATVASSTDASGVAVPPVLLIGVSFSGSRQDTLNFVALLENIPYQKTITDVSLSNADASTWKADVKFELILQYD